jgi:NADH-quinone oxidoreductase subunit H
MYGKATPWIGNKMGSDALEIIINIVKIVVIFLMMIQVVPLLVWVERRGSAYIQHRFGPNRVGPLGLMQLLADAVKFINKEEFVPGKGHKVLFYLAPIFALIPSSLAILAIPFGTAIHLGTFNWNGHAHGPYTIDLQGVNIPLGIIYIFGVSSLAAYPLLLAGWGSSNKFSMLGALRASAQMVSYELAMGIAAVGVLMLYGTFHLNDMIVAQDGPMSFAFLGAQYTFSFLPNCGIFYQPLGFFLFLVCGYAESNRLPFDLPEAEGELIAGYHTEYSGFKMLLFYIGEYGHMIVASALVTIFYFGGYHIPYVSTQALAQIIAGIIDSANLQSILMAVIYLLVTVIKISILMWIYIWVRWTLPRFRYDQLMDLGWKSMLPWALFNLMATTVVMYFAHH